MYIISTIFYERVLYIVQIGGEIYTHRTVHYRMWIGVKYARKEKSFSHIYICILHTSLAGVIDYSYLYPLSILNLTPYARIHIKPDVDLKVL